MVTTAGDFFIVDNSDEHWKALEYLRQWCGISSALDVATGHFEIGALLALDGEWQKIGRIRLLIGGQTSRTTVEAVRQAASTLDKSLADERTTDPFLRGLPGVVEGMRTGQIEVRVFRKKKFHAKAYITHSSLAVVGSAALVGSSNFTHPGLTRNVELNVRFTGAEVRELQDWYEHYWDQAEPITDDLLEVIERYARDSTPFEVYAKSLQVLTANVTPGEQEWERNSSTIYPLLAPYQRDAYLGLKQRARQWGGGFLTDGVGLGKTFVGLMLAEYYAVKERKNVLIMATKTGQDAVWLPELNKLLPELTGEFTNVRVMAHTDLSTADALDKMRSLTERADVVIIDEAHNFRNHGQQGDDPDNPKSRWWRMARICEGKTTFLLTATPINNTLFDFVHELELFTGIDDGYFADLGIGSLRSYVTNLERTFAPAGAGTAALDLTDFEQLLQQDKLLETLIVQNSRRFAVASSQVEGAAEVRFPEQQIPRAVPYDYDVAYSALLAELESAFQRNNPLFVLPMYYPLAYSNDDDVDPFVENRQRQVVGLIRTVFLKRFESSIAAFAGSCLRITRRVEDWIAANAGAAAGTTDRLEQWRSSAAEDMALVNRLFGTNPEDSYEEASDLELDEEADYELRLEPEAFDVQKMLNDAFADLDQLAALLHKVGLVGQAGDSKYLHLHKLLMGGAKEQKKRGELFDPAFTSQKVLVFTEFADTARYLHERLTADGLTDVDRLDGSRKGNRVTMIRRFAPHYNGLGTTERAGLKPLRVLISTDVLSEGVNLQDATQVINYDIHWNPVRLMQRIGRVDRRLNPDIEKAIIAENPKTKATRGTISVRNFLPNAELNRILSLYSRVQSRVLLISKTLGIPGGKLLDADDVLDDTKVFDAFLSEYEGDMSPAEQLRLKLLQFLEEDPDLASRLDQLPTGAHATKSGTPTGLFTCTVEPLRHQDDDGNVTWTIDPGRPRWVLHAGQDAITDLLDIDAAIACDPKTVGHQATDSDHLAHDLATHAKARQQQLFKNNVPMDAPRPTTPTWIEVI